MEQLVVDGPCRLSGSVRVHGAKNAILPILAATVISGKESVIHDCPDLSDVEQSLCILRYLGCSVHREGTDVVINSENITRSDIPKSLMEKMRSSFIFLGAIASRMRRAEISLPGGCELGPRPIDLHLKAFGKLGMDIWENDDIIYCKANDLHADDIYLDFPSVGATQNIMLISSSIDGITTIHNAAKEPEIEDLANFLCSMGASVCGAGTDTITIIGTKKFTNAEHTVMPDRIVAATYMCAAVMTRGDIEITNVNAKHLLVLAKPLLLCGAEIEIKNDSLRITQNHRPVSTSTIVTSPYPGFPTDMQSVLMSVFTVCDGTNVIKENIFKNRFRHIDGLRRMGADICVHDRTATITGVKTLYGACVCATDLRAGAALALAGLNAQGKTYIDGAEFIDRGYANFEHEYEKLGAKIWRI